MRTTAYYLCATLVGIPAIYGLAASLLSLAHVAVPYLLWFDPLLWFGSLVPRMFVYSVPRVLLSVLGYVMLLLFLRRLWLLASGRERVPASFAGFPKALGYVGAFSLGLGVAVLALSMVLKAGSGVPGGMLLIPAIICVPWAFFITEVLSLRGKRVKNAA